MPEPGFSNIGRPRRVVESESEDVVVKESSRRGEEVEELPAERAEHWKRKTRSCRTTQLRRHDARRGLC